MTDNQPTSERPGGLHGIDFGDGFLAVFCERENLLAMYPHVCPEPDARLAAQNDTGDTVGSLRATLATSEADGWRGWMCCEHHENRPNGLPCDGACCDDCPGLAAQNDTEVS